MKKKSLYLLSVAFLTAGFCAEANAGSFFYCAETEDENCCSQCNLSNCCGDCCSTANSTSSFFVSGEYLLWEVCQDGLAIAGSGSTYPGSIKHVDFNWTSGFRAGFGGRSCDGWTFEAAYTYMRPKGSAKVSGDQIYTTWIPSASIESYCTRFVEPPNTGRRTSVAVAIPQFSKAKSKVRFDYDLIDVELRHSVFCSPCFSFEAIAGLQGGILEQKNSAEFTGIFFYQSEDDRGDPDFVEREQATAPIEIESNQKWKFAGGGIRVGAAGEYRSCSGFLLFAAGRFNLLYGNSKLRYTTDVSNFGEFTFTPSFNFPELVDLSQEVFVAYYTVSGREKYCNFVPNFNTRLGFGFENTCGCFNFRLEAGWEITYWPNLAQYRKGLSNQNIEVENNESTTTKEGCIVNSSFTDPTEQNNDVALHGLVVSLQLAF